MGGQAGSGNKGIEWMNRWADVELNYVGGYMDGWLGFWADGVGVFVDGIGWDLGRLIIRIL